VITPHTAAKWKEDKKKTKVTEVTTGLNKGPKVYRESVFADGL
jgi:hypothetical protein